MKRTLMCVWACLLTLVLTAEQRYYFARGGELPTDALCTDLRPVSGLTTLVADNLQTDERYTYNFFNKPADSWWGLTWQTYGKNEVDMQHVTSQWTLKLKIKTTVPDTYPIHVVLNGTGTANAITLSPAQCPRNGKWHILSIPLSTYPISLNFTDKMKGKLFQLHSDGGEAGNILAIDYAYLTDDATQEDEGFVQSDKRYYLIINPKTPKQEGYTKVDYSQNIHYAATPWKQPSYVSYPFLLLEQPATKAQLQCRTKNYDYQWADVNASWYLQLMLYKTMEGDITLHLSNAAGSALQYTIDDAQLPLEEWTPLTIQLSSLTTDFALFTSEDIPIITLTMHNAANGTLSVAYAFFANNIQEDDPAPDMPRDPNAEQRIYLVNDGSPLPAGSVDYRANILEGIEVLYNNAMVRDASVQYLAARTRADQSSWWSIDLRARQLVNLSEVTPEWNLYIKLKTEVTYRPINIILYPNNAAVRYVMTEDILPLTATEGQELTLPMTTFIQSGNLGQFSGSASYFSFHADQSGITNALCAIEEMYFSFNNSEPTPPDVGSAYDETIIEDIFSAIPIVPVITEVTFSYIAGNLTIRGLTAPTQLKIYNVRGQLCRQTTIGLTTTETIPLVLPKGVYLAYANSVYCKFVI